MANTILEKLQEKYSTVTGIDDARNIAEAVAAINGVGGRGAGAIADQIEISYTVSFDAGLGTGSIGSMTGTYITVPAGCCLTVSVNNPTTVPVEVANANLIVNRVA